MPDNLRFSVTVHTIDQRQLGLTELEFICQRFPRWIKQILLLAVESVDSVLVKLSRAVEFFRIEVGCRADVLPDFILKLVYNRLQEEPGPALPKDDLRVTRGPVLPGAGYRLI